MVTAEFAVALPALVLVVLAALGGITVVTAQLRCVDAADVAARMAARGETLPAVRAVALPGAPAGADVTVVTAGDMVTATVQARVSAPGLSRLLPGIVVRAKVTDVVEPGAVATDHKDPL
jgi:Flp pilus assembly protein TadG